MNSPIFIAGQHKDKFQWKVDIYASFLEPPRKCEVCGGSGKIWGMLNYGDDDTCSECNGSGHPVGARPLVLWQQQRIVDMLQKQLDNYLNNPELLWEGAGI